MKTKLSVLTLLAACLGGVPSAVAQDTAFNYQGQLSANGSTAAGSYDLKFTLFDALSGGNQVGSPNTLSPVAVSNGVFAVSLDFGSAAFNGASRWLELAVRTNGAGTYASLSPRQRIMSAPYAVKSLSAGSAASYTGAVTDGQLSGNIARLNATNVFAGPVQFNNPGSTFTGNFSGNGAGVTNVSLVAANSGGAITWTTNNESGGFVLASSPSVGSAPNSVIAADVNGDGKLDLITANRLANTLSVVTNNGTGSFVIASAPGVGSAPYSVAVADVNGDGKQDLISANWSGNTLSVLTNNGSGSFVFASSPGVGSGPTSVTAADVNGDGKVDLISANRSANTLSVLTNNGSGGFVFASLLGVGLEPRSATAADVNGDGKPDLVCANESSNNLMVFTNNGSGSFVIASSPSVGSRPFSVKAVDVNGDGKVDLVSANFWGNTLSMLTNNGSGGFALASSPAVGSGPQSVSAADVNEDGKVDLISANYYDNTLSVLTNSGNGRFALASLLDVGSGPLSVTAADVNGDAKTDLICANANDNTLSVLLSTPAPSGTATFTATFTGSGAGLTALKASQLVGALAINGTTIIDAAGNWVGSTAGLDLNTIRSGSGAPASGLGANGDFYINTTAATLYGPKTGGSWGNRVSLTGPTGAQGPQGPQGLQGIQGIQGLPGPQGPANGTAVLSGSGVPDAALGQNGDFYVNTAATAIYGPKTSSGWGSATSLIGPAGPQGVAGAAGATGATGPQGATGATGATGPQGPQGPAVKTSAACMWGSYYSPLAYCQQFVCAGADKTVVGVGSSMGCQVTAETGSCNYVNGAAICCVCKP